MNTTSQLRTIPLDKIDVRDGFNPRTDSGVDDGFLESVRTHGVLTPVLVHPQGSGEATRFFLVAGQRRLTAAREVGHTEIPAVVRTEFANGSALPAALVENMQREQLTPIEEAHAFKRAFDDGMTLAEVAAAVGVSHDLVKDRVALLQLPAVAQEKIGAGELTLRAAAALKTLAPAGEAVVAKAAELVAAGKQADVWSDPVTADHLEDDPAWVLDQVLEELEDDAPFLIAFRKGYSVDVGTGRGAIAWPDDVDASELAAKAAQIPDSDPKTYRSPRRDALEITTADLDAARAYGCLLEVPSDGGRVQAWVSDAAWLVDRLGEKLDKAIKSWQRKQKTAAKKAGATPTGDPEKDAKAAKREENAKARADLLAARERNLTLGRALYKELHAPKVTLDALAAVGELLVDYAGDDLGRRGTRFVDENVQAVTTKKDGTISKVAYPRTNDQCRQLLRDKIRRATTAEQLLGVLLQAMVAARYAEVEAAPQHDRWGSLRSLDRYAPNRTLTGLLDKIAEPVLPPAVVEQLKERRAQEQRELEQAAEEDVANVRAGGETCPSCGNPARSIRGKKTDGWEPCECSDDAIRASSLACPRCGEPECYASCSGFELEAVVGDVEAEPVEA